MVAVKVSAFGGMVPVTEPRLLPDQAATLSQDTWLYSGDVLGMVEPSFVRALTTPSSGKAYRIPNNYFDADHFNDATWMEFASIDTDVIRSPIVGDTFDRYYWSSPVDQPRLNSLARIKAGSPPFALGVPQPPTPTLAITGGASGTTVSRAYVLTYVTAFGEEGPPSTPVVGTGKIDATWTTSFTAASGADTTKFNLSKVRVYRTVTSAAGVATFFFVAELAVTSTTYADTITDAVVSSNNQLQSTTWTGPPVDLVGWVALPNGIIAGWRGSELWFSEPFRPHAWPVQYALSVEYPIIGLGTINQTLVVLTAGYPLVATGINPASMVLSKLSSLEPCTSRGSILSTPEGVYYSSPNGLILVANGAAQNVTLGLVMKDDWNRLTKTSTLRAARLSNSYFAFGSSRPGFFQTSPAAWQSDWIQPEDFAGANTGVIIDPTNQRVAFNVLTSTAPTTNVSIDAWSGEVIVIRSGNIYRVDISNKTAARRPYTWRSKIFQAGDKKNFQAMKVYFAPPDVMPAPAGQIPTMTAPTTGGVTMVSNNFFEVYPAWKGANAVSDVGWASTDMTGPPYMQTTFPRPVAISSYQFGGFTDDPTELARLPKSWTLQALDDRGVWVTLDTRTNVTQPANSAAVLYSFANSVAYAAYRLVVSATYDNVRTLLNKFQLFDATTGMVRVYADDRLVMSRPLLVSGALMRLPAGFKADYWQIEFSGAATINSVQMATSVKELMKA